MNTRKVFVALEIETKAKISDLRVAQNWSSALYGCPSKMWGHCLQAQANVARTEKPNRCAKKKTKK